MVSLTKQDLYMNSGQLFVVSGWLGPTFMTVQKWSIRPKEVFMEEFDVFIFTSLFSTLKGPRKIQALFSLKNMKNMLWEMLSAGRDWCLKG